MKKIISALLIMQLFTLQGFSQRSCGAMEHLENLIEQNPSLIDLREQIEQATESAINNGLVPFRGRAVVTIPVVVHVVYNTSSQNISDAQIQSQLTVLNNDFRKLNSDWTNTPSAFQGLVADAEFQFCLAQRDPNGNATTGIIRKQTTVTSFSTNDNVKRSANGGSDAWPSGSYLNIWVCSISGGILGYAQFPGGPTSTDGVVVNFNAFGTTGTAAPFNRGRTATHEVGHWLNLFHIWGDDGTGCTGSDNVSDTPNQGDENYGCPSFPTTSCSNGPNGDMFMNYMDYTDDACMYMFSAGQKARMQSLFVSGGARVSLLSSLGCQAPSGTTTCGTPASPSTSALTQTSATLSWGAVSGAVSYNVQVKLASSTTWTTFSATTNSLSVTGLTASTSYNFQVQAVCASASSTYSAVATFTTAANISTCTDIYESNNTLNSAKTIALGTNINGLISSATDNDYFKFSNSSSRRNILVSLTNLPADYDLRLYNSRGTLIATSQNSSTASESIKFNSAPTGTYYARVNGYNGALNTSSCYTLNANTSNTAYKIQDESNVSNKKLSDIEFSMYPNPASDETKIDLFLAERMDMVSVKMFDMMGKAIAQYEYKEAEGVIETKLDTRLLPNGMYLVVISSPAGNETKKLWISK